MGRSGIQHRIRQLLLPALICMAGILPACAPLQWLGGASGTRMPGAEDPAGEVSRYIDARGSLVAGLAVAGFSAEKKEFSVFSGYTDKKKKNPVNADTVFDWGQCSSVLVWISAMQLAEQGRLDLSADIRSYLPESVSAAMKDDRAVTMIHLMNHTAGYQDVVRGRALAPGRTAADLGTALVQMKPEQIFSPGEVTAFSGWGTALAACAVENISGQSFGKYAETHIFMPLGMDNTAILPDLSDNPAVRERRENLMCYTWYGRNLGNCLAVRPLYPADMCVGTADDFSSLAQALLPAGTAWRQIFARQSTLLEMLRETDTYADAMPKNSHGLWHIYCGTALTGHEGKSTGCTSEMVLDLAGNTGLCVMSNQRDENLFRTGIRELVYGSYAGSPYDRDRPLPGGLFGPAENVWKGPLSILSLWTPPLVIPQMTGRLSSYRQTSVLPDGRVILEQACTDWIGLPRDQAVIRCLLLAGFAAAVLGAFRSLLSGIRHMLRRGLSLDGEVPESDARLRAAGLAGDLLVILPAVGIAVLRQLTGRAEGKGGFPLVLSVDAAAGLLLALLAVLTPVLYVKAKRRGETGQKVLPLLRREVRWMILIVNILYWQMYRFWE